MIHKNRGNRRWVDKRKRRHKYNLVQKIWGDAKTFLDGVLGKYDKGKIHDSCNFAKTNNRTASNDHIGANRLGNNYSHSDRKKVESCNDKLQDYESWFDDDVYNAAIADCEDWHETFEDEVNE